MTSPFDNMSRCLFRPQNNYEGACTYIHCRNAHLCKSRFTMRGNTGSRTSNTEPGSTMIVTSIQCYPRVSASLTPRLVNGIQLRTSCQKSHTLYIVYIGLQSNTRLTCSSLAAIICVDLAWVWYSLDVNMCIQSPSTGTYGWTLNGLRVLHPLGQSCPNCMKFSLRVLYIRRNGRIDIEIS